MNILKFEVTVFVEEERIEVKKLVTDKHEEISLDDWKQEMIGIKKFDGTSERIKQFLQVIEEIRANLHQQKIYPKITIFRNAIREVARINKKEYSTVHDKIGRKSRLNGTKARKLIFEYLLDGSDELKEYLLSGLREPTLERDRYWINLILSEDKETIRRRWLRV